MQTLNLTRFNMILYRPRLSPIAIWLQVKHNDWPWHTFPWFPLCLYWLPHNHVAPGTASWMCSSLKQVVPPSQSSLVPNKGNVQNEQNMCLWNMDAPSGNPVKISPSPTFWPKPPGAYDVSEVMRTLRWTYSPMLVTVSDYHRQKYVKYFTLPLNVRRE